MAKLGDLIVRIGADTRDLNKQLGRVQREMRSMTGNLTQLGQNMTRAITVPLAGLGALAVKSAADLEKLEASFVSLTGGVDQAAAMMKQLNEFTASTPFQIENVANAARQLIASGTKVSEVNNQLRFLGDIAATSGVTIEEIAAIFAKVNAKGKVELENLNQLAERGVPIFKALADATGLPADSLGAGAVSVQQFNDVLKSFAEEGGFAAGAMERLSQTAAGRFSTAVDNAKFALANVGEQILPMVNKGLEQATKLLQGFSKLTPETIKLAGGLSLVLGTLGPLVTMMPKIISSVDMLRKSFLLTTPAILGVAAVVGTVVGLFMRIKNEASQSADEIKEVQKALDELTETELRREAGVSKTAGREAINLAIEDSLKKVAEAQEELNKIEAEIQKGGQGLRAVYKNKIADIKEYQDEMQRSADAGQQLLVFLDEQEKGARQAASATKELSQQFTTLDEILTNWSTEGKKKITLPILEGIEEIEEAFEEIELEFDYDPSKVISQFEKLRDFTTGLAKDIESALQTALTDSLVALGEGIGKLLSGGLKGVNLMAGALMQLGNLMKSIGKAMVAQATAMITFQKTLFKNPYLAAAAGVAFIAAGALLSNYATNLQEMPALAEGGLAYGATTAIVGDNPNARIDPEVIAPLSKLQDMMGGQRVEVFGRISGDDIYLSNARTSRNRNRYS
jgi:tape measure domain-containing protein